MNESDNIQAVTVIETRPITLIEKALDKGLSIEQLGKLFDLQERWEKREAAKSFLEAKANFQRTCPQIKKTKKVDYPLQGGGNIKYSYAPLGDIAEQIKEPLHTNGLSYRWEFAENGDKIKCTCHLSHSAGHSEATAMESPLDTSGKKGIIQQIGSTHTYLQRYTLIGALGISTADEDVDGRHPEKKESKPLISEKQPKSSNESPVQKRTLTEKDMDLQIEIMNLREKKKEAIKNKEWTKRIDEIMKNQEVESFEKVKNLLATL